MHEVLVNRLGGLSLPGKRVVRLTDRPDMTIDVYRGRKTTTQQNFLIWRSDIPVYSHTKTVPNTSTECSSLSCFIPTLIDIKHPVLPIGL